ncbi:hypothetical protein AU509_17220 [Lonsdalea britannica]|uniref:Tail fiber assembly protein n=1 Tax=Lonsdalea britannica TaxID=1082704 RepID=A0AAD0SK23_9GAMM|nr:hypothetical protein [Lonsdalea britannica]AXW85565.1 hypothetical protein CKQ53_00230 [Lonsdalea britannica]AXW88691.1 hypothetical protein CKQ53_18070 [Lonsdalea britannica]OSM93794.1 hypothetical protein AU509_17220 [Lonsdalea britannica]
MYKFSNGMFYPYILEQAYSAAGTWPDDGVDVDESTLRLFSVAQAGKTLGTDEHGYPCWVEMTVYSDAEYRPEETTTNNNHGDI